jgi:CPA1 family monovalent cation:H+ antiporter
MSSLHRYFWLFVCILFLILNLTACTSLNHGTLIQPESTNVIPLGTPAVSDQATSPSTGANLAGESNQAETEDNQILIIEEVVISLLFIATVVGIVARRLRVPYTVGLVLIGLILALMPQIQIHVPPNLILGLLVPPLIFEAAFHLNLNELRANLATIIAFAVPGVILTMFLVGGVVAWGADLPLTIALVFGALVAATDPVAVIALFARLNVPKRLQLLLEGESLFNDGTAIVLFSLVIAVALQGKFNLISSLSEFVIIAGGGLIVGLILGILVSQLIVRIDDHLIETTLTSILAFGAYLIAEILGVSGVLAVAMAGLVNGNIGPRGMSPTTRIVVFNFWEYVSFLANSFAFLLLGLQIDLAVLLVYWQPILTAILAVLAARLVTVYGLAWVGRDIPLKWQHVLYWGGLRGAISLALALGLPETLGAARGQLQVMAFGVVLFTLIVQGFTMEPLVRSLHLTERNPIQDEYERRHARAVAVRSAYDHLEKMRQNGLISDHTWQTLSPLLKKHNQVLIEAVKEVITTDPSVEEEELNTARRESLRAQRSTLNLLLTDRIISEETYSTLVSEIDAALTDETGGWPDLIRSHRNRQVPIDRLMAAVIQEQDFENALSTLTNLGLSVTHLPTAGGFLGRRNITLLIGISKGQEEATVRALHRSCKQRIEYLATPLEGTAMPLPTPMPITVGGATIFTFEVERYEDL